MEKNGKKKRNIMMIGCVAVCVCLAVGAATAVFLLHRNPLTKGLSNLAKEIQAWEVETGESFLVSAINRVGSGNVRAEYSADISGISGLPNMTLGLDGAIKRDMEERLFAMETDFSIANTQLAKTSLFGTEEQIYLQMPTVWDGSVVFEAENISGQWNGSAIKAGLALLTGQDLTIAQRIDGKLFQTFSMESFSTESFLEKHKEDFKELYANMVVINMEKARKENLLSETQADSLGEYILKDEAGEQIETVCYLVNLPAKELVPFFGDNAVDISLCVYLDGGERIVRISTVPEETLEIKYAKGEIAVNLTGKEATIDRVEIEFAGTEDNARVSSALLGEEEAEGRVIVEKESDTVVLEIEKFLLKSQNEMLCRGKGEVRFMPLEEKLQMPAGTQRRVGEMNKLETMLFMAECTKKIYSNFGGYLKMIGF